MADIVFNTHNSCEVEFESTTIQATTASQAPTWDVKTWLVKFKTRS